MRRTGINSVISCTHLGVAAGTVRGFQNEITTLNTLIQFYIKVIRLFKIGHAAIRVFYRSSAHHEPRNVSEEFTVGRLVSNAVRHVDNNGAALWSYLTSDNNGAATDNNHRNTSGRICVREPHKCFIFSVAIVINVSA